MKQTIFYQWLQNKIGDLFFLFIHLIKYSKIFICMTIQPLDTVIQFIFRKIIIFRVVGLNFTSINRTKSPFYCTRKPTVKFMENFFQTVYITFPKISDCTKIRFYTSKHPLYFQIHFAAFCQFA